MAKIAATLILHELGPRLKKKGLGIENSPVSPPEMACLAWAKSLGILTTHEIRQMLDRRFAET